jgi:von Willebrand factor type A domain
MDRPLSFRFLLPVLLSCLGLYSPAQMSNASPNFAMVSTARDSAGFSTGIIFRRSVEEASVRFVVSNERGNTGALTTKEIQVVDDQVVVNDLKSFRRLPRPAMRLSILADMSDSVTGGERKTALQVINQLERIFDPEHDRATLVGFSSKAARLQESTGDLHIVGQVLQSQPEKRGLTSLFDTIIAECRAHFTGGDPETEDQIILLFTDGSDTLSVHGLNDAVDAAKRAHVTIYAVSAAFGDKTGLSNLRTLASETGGKSYAIRKADDRNAVVADLRLSRLKDEYVVTFRPATQRAGYHKVQVLISGNTAKIEAAPGYFVDEP